MKVTGVPFSPFNKTAENDALRALGDGFEPLKQLTPGMGSYINEVCALQTSRVVRSDIDSQGWLGEKDWQKTFWGSHYQRLLKIKKKVDPEDTLWCFPCVGSEGWKQRENGRLCKIY